MSDGSGTTTSGYDAQDRLTSKATPQGTLSSTYGPNGNVLSVRSSNANDVALDYRYDTLNRLDQVTDTRLSPGVTSSGYDPASNLTTTTQPNGVLTTATYNEVDRLTHLASTKNGSTLTSVAYTLRPSGLRTQIVEQDGRTSSYSYDDAQRLLSETISNASPSGSISYGYDHTGNRLSRTSSVAGIPSSTSSYDANDRIAGVTYDNNGNITAADGVTYSYDYANRITGTSTGVSIQYTGDGVRVSETVAGITTQYLVDEHNPTGYAQVVEEIRNGQVQTRYTYGRDLISQTMVGAGATSFYTYDGLGSVRALTNSAGSVTDRYAYDAFGTDIATSGAGTPNAYRFTGEQQDAALGMYYLRARYYQPGSGRFWTRDTWGLDQQNPREWNRYVYVAADPVNGVDPRGYLSVAGDYALTQKKISLRALPTLTVLGLSLACIYARVSSEYATALAIAQGGGQRVELNPCETGVDRKTCATRHPKYIKCEQLPYEYRYTDINQAAAALGQGTRVRPTTRKPDKNGPCSIYSGYKPGWHYEVRQGRWYLGSITTCECCWDTSTGPKTETRCRIH